MHVGEEHLVFTLLGLLDRVQLPLLALEGIEIGFLGDKLLQELLVVVGALRDNLQVTA